MGDRGLRVRSVCCGSRVGVERRWVERRWVECSSRRSLGIFGLLRILEIMFFVSLMKALCILHHGKA